MNTATRASAALGLDEHRSDMRNVSLGRFRWIANALKALVFGLGSAALAAGLLFVPATAWAQDPDIEALLRQLKERDQVILELLERVEGLERRVGVQRLPTDQDAEDVATAEPSPVAANKAAPGVIEVDEDAAERALERSLTLSGALLLPPAVLEIEPSLTYARQEDATPSFVTSGQQVLASETERNADSLVGDLDLRLGLPWDSQVEVGMSYRWREVETVTNVGFSPTAASELSGAALGDLRIGLAKTLLREGLWRPDLVARVTWDTDTGKSSDNGVALGGGGHEIQGSLTAIKRQDPVAFIGSLSYRHAFEHNGLKPGPTLGTNFGGLIALSPEASLRLLLSGAYQGETEFAGTGIPGSDRTIGALQIGGSTLIAPGVLLDLAADIGLTDDAGDLAVTLSLPIRLGPLSSRAFR